MKRDVHCSGRRRADGLFSIACAGRKVTSRIKDEVGETLLSIRPWRDAASRGQTVKDALAAAVFRARSSMSWL